MTKNDYRSFFANVKPFIKLAYFIKRAGIPSSAMSLFMKDEAYNYVLSLERLNGLYADICETLENIA